MEQERDAGGIDLPVINAGAILAILTVLFLAVPAHPERWIGGARDPWRLLGAWLIGALRGDGSTWRMLLVWFVVAVALGVALPRLSTLALAFIPPLIASVPFTRAMFGDFGPGDIINRSGFLIPIVDAVLLSPIFFIGVFGIGLGIRLSEIPEQLDDRRAARKAGLR